MDYGIKVLLAYLLGSIVGSLLLGRLKGVDIRKMGSGNAGATNAIRTQGKGFGIAVFAIDIAKGWIASGLLPQLQLPGIPPSAPDLAAWLVPSCAFAAILGHVFPLWHGFRGGKGVATLIGAFAGYDPWLLLPMVATWLGVILVSGFVGLASICAALSLPVYLLIRDGAVFHPELCFGIACALLVMFTHRGNVARMRAGTEPRARRLWLFGRGGA
jgi:glycerol-3-phosphate acyltransferase PlsY